MNNLFILYDVGITVLVRHLNGMVSVLHRYLHSAQLSRREQIIVYKRLAMMLQSDMSIVTALQLMTDETSRRSVRTILTKVTEDVSAGMRLSVALQNMNPRLVRIV